MSAPPPIRSRRITHALLGHLRLRGKGSIIMPNVYVDNSPWESDVIRVTKAGYWVEYEIKTSLADYRADFNKERSIGCLQPINKHAAYQTKEAIELRRYRSEHSRQIPKPKHFYFVTPVGLLDNVELPPHCGLLEFDPEAKRTWGIRTQRRAPTLKPATQLGPEAIFGLAMKAAYRIHIPQ